MAFVDVAALNLMPTTMLAVPAGTRVVGTVYVTQTPGDPAELTVDPICVAPALKNCRNS